MGEVGGWEWGAVDGCGRGCLYKTCVQVVAFVFPCSETNEKVPYYHMAVAVGAADAVGMLWVARG